MKAYQIVIKLSGTNIFRRVIIPADINFNGLHRVIQACMGWENYHMYQFEIGEKLVLLESQDVVEDYSYMQLAQHRAKFERSPINTPEQIREEVLAIQSLTRYEVSKKVKIDPYIQNSDFIYIYDLGDYWVHEIVFEFVREDYEFGYPTCVDGFGDCPPEDVGGVGGYAEFLEIMQDKNHPEYEEMNEWFEECEYSGQFDLDSINDLMKRRLKLKRK